jgi:hypothetical protein
LPEFNSTTESNPKKSPPDKILHPQQLTISPRWRTKHSSQRRPQTRATTSASSPLWPQPAGGGPASAAMEVIPCPVRRADRFDLDCCGTHCRRIG